MVDSAFWAAAAAVVAGSAHAGSATAAHASKAAERATRDMEKVFIIIHPLEQDWFDEWSGNG
ncbi:MAG: hypothetical protein ACT4P0_08125 [Panacagrimonas sp.]